MPTFDFLHCLLSWTVTLVVTLSSDLVRLLLFESHWSFRYVRLPVYGLTKGSVAIKQYVLSQYQQCSVKTFFKAESQNELSRSVWVYLRFSKSQNGEPLRHSCAATLCWEETHRQLDFQIRQTLELWSWASPVCWNLTEPCLIFCELSRSWPRCSYQLVSARQGLVWECFRIL